MTDLPKTMRAVHLTGHGGPEVLDVRSDVTVPAVGQRDVLIRVGAAGVNNTDINTRLAWYSKGEGDSADATWAGEPLKFPRIQGIDICGTIVAVGDGVPSDRIGTRVLVEPCLREFGGKALVQPWFVGSECDGGFAEYAVMPSAHAYAVESPLTDTDLASFPCSYSTAENMLTRARVGPTDTVLVTGASGGVGSAAVQLAKARGAHVIALTSPDKVEILREIGADRTVLRSEPLLETLGRDSADVIVDLVAGDGFPDLLEILRPSGRYAVAGAVGGPIVPLDVRTLYLKDLSFFGCTALDDGVFAHLVRLIATGAIKPLVAETFPLEEISKAQETFAAKRYVGKIVLEVAR